MAIMMLSYGFKNKFNIYVVVLKLKNNYFLFISFIILDSQSAVSQLMDMPHGRGTHQDH